MSKKKQGGKLIQQKRPQPKYLGVKVYDGEKVKKGAIIVRQRGTKHLAGKGVDVGRDHSLFAIAEGIVKFKKNKGRSMVEVV